MSALPPALVEEDLPDGGQLRLIESRHVDGDLRHRMVQLLRAAFGDEWPGFAVPAGQEEHLQWKLDGPFPGDPSYVSLVEVEERLVGLSVKLRERARIRGVEVPIQGGGDGCTHPDYQGHGLYRRRKDFEGNSFERWVAGSLTTAGDARVLHDRAWRYEHMDERNAPRILVRVFHGVRYANARREEVPLWRRAARTLAFVVLQAAGSLLALRRSPSTPGLRIEETREFDDRFDELFEDCASQFDFIKCRPAVYLNWRYADRRGGAYRVFSAVDGERLVGYLVLKPGADRWYVMDLLARPGRLEVARALLAHGIDVIRAADGAAALCWLPDQHPYRSLFRRAGFVGAGRNTGLAITAFSPQGGVLDPIRKGPVNLHVMIGDTDAA